MRIRVLRSARLLVGLVLLDFHHARHLFPEQHVLRRSRYDVPIGLQRRRLFRLVRPGIEPVLGHGRPNLQLVRRLADDADVSLRLLGLRYLLGKLHAKLDPVLGHLSGTDLRLVRPVG